MKIADEEAIAIAKKILFNPYTINELGKIVKSDELSLWEEYDRFSTIDEDDDDYFDIQLFLAIIRKALADDFSLEKYYVGDMHCVDCGKIVHFAHKEDCDNFYTHNKDISIRKIAFIWDGDNTFATPLKQMFSESGYCDLISVKTCQEAVVAFS